MLLARFLSTFSLLLLIFLNILIVDANINETMLFHKNSENCSLYCRLYRALHNIVINMNRLDRPIAIIPGVELVPINKNQTSLPRNSSIIESFSSYLRTHELFIKFSELLEDANNQNNQSHLIVEARKKDKGQGMLVVMSVMFAKMMALMGIGGISILAMKALGVASMALVLAVVIGLKALSQQGIDSTRSVQYLTTDGHLHKRRRRRHVDLSQNKNVADTLSLPYGGWQNLIKA